MIESEVLGFWDEFGLPANIEFKTNLTLDDLNFDFESREKGMPTIGIKYSISRDKIKYGGIFNKKYEDCLVLRNMEFVGCSSFVFTCRNIGNISNVAIYRLGIGAAQTQINKKNRRLNGGTLSKIAGMMTKVDESAMNDEYIFYRAVINVIKELYKI